jgi:nucleotide-binding universal stress UspA family protein
MFERILAAIDGDPLRSQKVLEATRQLALAFESQVLVVHVREVERSPAAVPRAHAGALPPLIQLESPERAREVVEAAVAELRQAGTNARGDVGNGAGSTARQLLTMAAAFRATLIVIGDRDSRVSDLILGGVAHRVVHLAPTPVLVVR